MFNRAYSVIPILISLMVGALRPNEMLHCLGYRTLQHELTALERFRYGVVFMLVYGISLLVVVVIF